MITAPHTRAAVGVSQVEASAVWGGLAVGLCGAPGGLPADRKINDRESRAGFTQQEGWREDDDEDVTGCK